MRFFMGDSEDLLERIPYQYHPSVKTRSRDIPVQRNFSSPMAKSIPVHYAPTITIRSKAVLQIQKVFRGFLVRKRVKVILGIKKEVDEIEKKFYEKGMIDLLKKDSKERLKLNEMLMGLLLKLDSIRGIDSGVRELRKSVITKAIMLQERLDSIVFEQEECQEILDGEGEQNWELVDHGVDEVGDSNFDGVEGNLEEYCGKKQEEEEDDETMEIECKQEKKSDDGMKELMEKNDMLIGMVTDLCERNKEQAQLNQMQARVISSLLKRVDNLERSFRNERINCKKQRNQVADDNKKSLAIKL